jgi:hypothetical protein
MSQKKKEQLSIELELDNLGIDINEVDLDLIDTIYEFISSVYLNIKTSDEIINDDALSNFTNKLINEGRQNVVKKDS